jgi:hypothetical protein
MENPLDSQKIDASLRLRATASGLAFFGVIRSPQIASNDA